MYHYVKGKGWVYTPPAKIKVYASNDRIAIIRVVDVPEGVSRSISEADIDDSPPYSYLKCHEYASTNYAIGPLTNGLLAPSHWLCAIKLEDLP